VLIMDDRQRLLARVYSREGAAEEPQEYRDPSTGTPVRMTPSEWALAEFDRLHPAESSAVSDRHPADRGLDGSRVHRIGTAARNDAARVGNAADARSGDSEQHAEDDAAADDEGDDEGDGDRTAGGRGRGPSWVRRAAPALIGAGAFVLGVLVATGVSAATGGGDHAPSTPAAATTTIIPDDAFRPLPGPAIQEFFRTAPRVDDLPAAVTSGFVPTSFHLVAGSVTMQQSATLYAAKRLDDEYCLVAVAGGSRVAETCSTVEGIALHGLTLAKDAVRDVDGRPLTVTVTAARDGTIRWEAMPSAG
jgi:hypothetical protein